MADEHALATGALAADPAQRWEQYSTQELRAIVSRGLAGGDEVALAIAETERRARASSTIASTPGPGAGTARQPSYRILMLATAATILVALAIGLWLST